MKYEADVSKIEIFSWELVISNKKKEKKEGAYCRGLLIVSHPIFKRNNGIPDQWVP